MFVRFIVLVLSFIFLACGSSTKKYEGAPAEGGASGKYDGAPEADLSRIFAQNSTLECELDAEVGDCWTPLVKIEGAQYYRFYECNQALTASGFDALDIRTNDGMTVKCQAKDEYAKDRVCCGVFAE